MSFIEKDDIIEEVGTITELLHESTERLSHLPRTATAARQLAVIVNRLEGWKRTFGPLEERKPLPKGARFSRIEVDKALKAYRKYGYFNLTEDQKEAIRYFDEHFRQTP